MKFTIMILAALSFSAAAQAGVGCRQAMEEAIRKPGHEYKFESVTLIPISEEHMTEVSALVLDWVPNSDARSEYYLLVSATCRAADGKSGKLKDLELFDDMPGEGGVTVKTVTKARY